MKSKLLNVYLALPIVLVKILDGSKFVLIFNVSYHLWLATVLLVVVVAMDVVKGLYF